MNYKEWTHGQWGRIISALIGPQFANPRKHGPCPCGEGKDRYRFSDIYKGGQYHCSCSDGRKGGFDLLQCYLKTDFNGAVAAVEQVIGPRPKQNEDVIRKSSYAERLHTEAIKSDVSRYLEGRGLVMAPGLRWHRAVEYWQDNEESGEKEMLGKWPAMLSPLTSVTGAFLTYHVTYIEDGKKAPVPTPRKLLPAYQSTSGASCHLFPSAEEMGVAEGVETAIAAHMLFGMPVWAALNTALLGNFVPPEGCKKLWIFGDNDRNYAGHKAAYSLAHKLAGKMDVEVKLPLSPGDWNDVLLLNKC